MRGAKPPRRTQRIPDAQRKRPRTNLTLDPRAAAFLHSLPASAGSASEYVSQLVLDEAHRMATERSRTPEILCDGSPRTLQGAAGHEHE